MNGSNESFSILPACVPLLPGGEYSLDIKQVVKGVVKAGDADVEYSKSSQPFHVSAPRISLDAALVYSVYPPREANGSFSDCLPHVVLTRRTLPWERKIDVNGSNTDPTKEVPWLALLLLDEDDLKDGENRRSAQPGARKDLKLPLDAFEKEDEPCRLLRLPLELFRKIAPSREDLPYLAHVRRVEQDNMAADGVRDAGWFSVVVSNRLPTAGKAYEVFLVSLEGLWAHLPSDEAHPKEDQREEVKEVSIIVLASWTFTNNDTKKGFGEITKALRKRTAPLTLGTRIGAGGTIERSKLEGVSGPWCIVRHEENGPSDPGKAAAIANAIIDAGYVPMAHTTRRGDRIMSWYRGALVPEFVPTQQLVSFSCADAALRYDAHLGVFDVSYAAAWQLGRLLALQNQHFVRALRSLALRERLELQQQQARQEFLGRFGAESRQTTTFEEAVIQLLAGPTTPAGARDTAGSGAGKPAADGDDKSVPPAEITQWLGRLFVLHGVPFSYLVAQPGLLPPESIRLFYLDSAWIAALLDGALSLARSTMTPFLLQRAMAGEYLQVQSLPDDPPENTPGTPSIVRHVTGFLIRSELVSGWRGVKIVAASTSGGRLEVLRMERMADDLLLCIYNGKLGRIELTEPPHAVHFAVKENDQPAPRASAKALAIAKFAGSMAVTEFVDRMLAKPKHVVLEIEH